LDKTSKIIDVLKKYVPEGTEDYLYSLFKTYPVKFKIVSPRRSKLGDFRSPIGAEKPQITINGDLNKYSFLVTTVHEFAHLKTWMEHKNQVKPHGIEWKQNFVDLMFPIIQKGLLPRDVEQGLLNSFMNMKASSCTDVQLHRVLKQYDELGPNQFLLEKLPKYATFALESKIFQKGDLRRTRYLCTEVRTNRKFLINKLAVVEQVNYDK